MPDGIRIDAVASMLYLTMDAMTENGWPTSTAAMRTSDAIEFLKHLNPIMHKRNPGVMMIAEESTAWPMITG